MSVIFNTVDGYIYIFQSELFWFYFIWRNKILRSRMKIWYFVYIFLKYKLCVLNKYSIIRFFVQIQLNHSYINKCSIYTRLFDQMQFNSTYESQFRYTINYSISFFFRLVQAMHHHSISIILFM